jgi:hypothetical protein
VVVLLRELFCGGGGGLGGLGGQKKLRLLTIGVAVGWFGFGLGIASVRFFLDM